jgi:hypothetical protein
LRYAVVVVADAFDLVRETCANPDSPRDCGQVADAGGLSFGVVMRGFPEMPPDFIALSAFSAWLQGFRSR